MKTDSNPTQLLHLRVNNIDTPTGLAYVGECVREPFTKTHSLFFLNAHCFNVSLDDSAYLHALTNSDLLLNDGAGIKIASKLNAIALRENMNGTDFIPKIIEHSGVVNARVFILGARPGIADKAATTWKERYKNIDICGVQSGFFDDVDVVIQNIIDVKTDILIIGMGVPIQEIWLEKHRHQLHGVKLAVAGGAILDFTAGEFKRAPEWVQKIGMEWLYRLLQEPTRLFKRYIFGNVRFLAHVYKRKLFG